MTEVLTPDEQIMLEWFESPKGREALMTSDLANAHYEKLLAKVKSPNVAAVRIAQAVNKPIVNLWDKFNKDAQPQ